MRQYHWIIAIMLFGASTLALADEADDERLGRDIYRDYCASCHGGEMMNPGLAFDLRKFPKAEAERFRNAVLHGKGKGMPALEGKLSAEDIKALWVYVKSGG